MSTPAKPATTGTRHQWLRPAPVVGNPEIGSGPRNQEVRHV
jgi:hypothetical protein